MIQKQPHQMDRIMQMASSRVLLELSLPVYSDSGPAEKKAVNGSIHTYSWSLSADSDVHREIHQ